MHPQASAHGHCLMVTNDAQIIPLELQVDLLAEGVRVVCSQMGSSPLSAIHLFRGPDAEFILSVLRLDDTFQHSSDQLVNSGVA
jgi:hypothetical protein